MTEGRARRAPRPHDGGRRRLRAVLLRPVFERRFEMLTPPLRSYDIGLLPAPGPPHRQRRLRRAEMDAVVRDIEQWGEGLPRRPARRAARLVPRRRRQGARRAEKARQPARPPPRGAGARPRPAPRRARSKSLLGPGVSVYFSQVFFKPPEGGGPKPAHQDNFYFGPTDIEGVATAWIALDDATLENGCLYFGDGTNQGPVYTHFAPEGEPYNLQLPPAMLDKQPMTPAPVQQGRRQLPPRQHLPPVGRRTTATHWRRACALHLRAQRRRVRARPALPYDHGSSSRSPEAPLPRPRDHPRLETT